MVCRRVKGLLVSDLCGLRADHAVNVPDSGQEAGHSHALYVQT